MISGIISVRRYCPNCGNISTGFRGENGIAKMTCQICGTVLVSRIKSRRHDCLDIYAPKGAVLECAATESAVFCEYCAESIGV